MPKRIRLGTVTNGSLDSTDATIEIDGDDLYITVENGDVRTDGTVAFEDAAADPSANGELQRNGADLKAFSGGAVRSLSNIGSGVWETVTGAIRPDTADTDVIPNGDSSLGTGSDPWPAVTADEADITNETLVLATGNADVTGNTADDWISPDWSEVKDERGEFSPSNEQFTPDTTGWYWVSSMLRIESPSDQDRLQTRLWNDSDSTDVYTSPNNTVSGTPGLHNTPPLSGLFELTAGKNYEINVRNRDSNFDISRFNAVWSIRSAYR